MGFNSKFVKTGGAIGFAAGICAIPFVPGLSALAKSVVVTATPVIGILGLSTIAGAYIGRQLGKA